jgi:hypothetical protein
LILLAQVAEFAIAFAIERPPAKTMPEFVDWARTHPASAAFGTPGAAVYRIFSA